MEVDIKQLVQEKVHQSFPIAPIPAELFLTSHFDQTEIPSKISTGFSNRIWTDISLDAWIHTASVHVFMTYLTPAAFHYYLPSLLTNVLPEPNYLGMGLESLLPQNKNRAPKGQWWFEYFDLFSVDQRTAIKLFLSYAKEKSTPHSEEEWLISCVETIWENRGQTE